ncbi:probable LIM domain-containing serine/threonine-protein kinase DDB_G0286997 [Anarrhichthys ocellatus]|uniref:probable LIM domain-containing serine/threonine-protein kinase DDB_G0286997 n=1 Tax=Anarrhichthys ocellatus TaxID=433405 RepID=UPI0012ED8A6D|nr:probable LIM domain-containing serine/threonine-protein kinase DDB_G0286997 [Anarrhichthys ocellatus]
MDSPNPQRSNMPIPLNNRFSALASPPGEVRGGNVLHRSRPLLPTGRTTQPPHPHSLPPHPHSLPTHIYLQAKSYFKLLQAIHHSEILNTTFNNHTFPQGMMRKVTRLTSFIKPSSPNETTQLKIQQNTDTWMLNNMHILREHYDSVIAVGLETIPTFNQIPFDKALQWGRSRYGRKLTSSSINTLRDITSKSPPTEGGAPMSRLSPLDYPPLPNPVNPLLFQQLDPSHHPISPPLTTTLLITPSSPPSLTSLTPALKIQTPPTSPSPPPLTPSSFPLLPPYRDLCTPSEGAGAFDVVAPPTTHLLECNPPLTVEVEIHPLPPRESGRLRARRAERPVISPAPSSPSPSHTDATHPPQTHYSNVALPCSNTISSSFSIDTPHHLICPLLPPAATPRPHLALQDARNHTRTPTLTAKFRTGRWRCGRRPW